MANSSVSFTLVDVLKVVVLVGLVDDLDDCLDALLGVSFSNKVYLLE